MLYVTYIHYNLDASIHQYTIGHFHRSVRRLVWNGLGECSVSLNHSRESILIYTVRPFLQHHLYLTYAETSAMSTHSILSISGPVTTRMVSRSVLPCGKKPRALTTPVPPKKRHFVRSPSSWSFTHSGNCGGERGSFAFALQLAAPRGTFVSPVIFQARRVDDELVQSR